MLRKELWALLQFNYPFESISESLINICPHSNPSLQLEYRCLPSRYGVAELLLSLSSRAESIDLEDGIRVDRQREDKH